MSITCTYLSFGESKIDVADNSELSIVHTAGRLSDEFFAGTSLSVGQGGFLQCTKLTLETGVWTGSGTGQIGFDSVGGTAITFDFPAGMLHCTGGLGFTINLGDITVDGNANTSPGSENRGTIEQRDSGQLSIDGDFTNSVGGLYDIQSDRGIDLLDIGNGQLGSGRFVNFGTVRKSAGVGTSTVSAPLENSGGTLEVQTGILALTNGGTFASGIFNVAGGAFLDLHSIAYSGTFTGSGTGLVRLFTGLTLGPTGATFNFNGQWVGGLWSLGDTGLTNLGKLIIDGADTRVFSGVFTNVGVFTDRATVDLQIGFTGFNGDLHPGTLNNTIDGVYDFQADSYLDNGTPGATINNAGVIRKSAGSGESGIGSGVNADLNFTSTGGIFDIRSGTFTDFVGGIFTGGGVFDAAAGTILDLAGDFIHPTIVSGAFTGSGAGIVRFRGRELRSGAAGTTFNFTPGLFQWTAVGQSTMTGADLTNLGSITLAGAGIEQISNTFFNAGTILHVGIGNLDLDFGAIVTNQVGAVYDFQADQSVVDSGTFINRGTLRKSGGTGTSSMSPHVFQNDRGLIDVRSGILALNPTDSGNSTGGTFEVAKDAVLDLNSQGASSYTGTYSGSGAGVVRLGLVDAPYLGFGLTVAGATFNFPAGMFQWFGGALDGGATGFNNTAFITLAGADTKHLRGVFNNAGTIVHAGTGELNFAVANTILNNLPGGLYDVQGDVNFTGNGCGRQPVQQRRHSAQVGRRRLGGALSGCDFQNLGGTIDVRTGAVLADSLYQRHIGSHRGDVQRRQGRRCSNCRMES